MGRLNLKKETIIHKENTVKKSNELSMAKLKHGLTLNQTQLLMFAIYSTQTTGKTEFRKFEFEKKFNIKNYTITEANRDVLKIIDLKLTFVALEENKFKYQNVFQHIDYDKGLFDFKWSQDFVPHILELKEKYVVTDLSITANFRSSFSWTLYDYLRGNYGSWFKILSKKNVIDLFAIEKTTSYEKNTGLLRAKVLDVAVKEINEYTELEVEIENIKKGRSIVGFKIIWSNGKKVNAASPKQMEILGLLLNTIRKDTLKFINLDNADNREEVIKIIKETEEMFSNLEEPISITSDHAKKLTDKASNYLIKLNNFLAAENKEVVEYDIEVPLFNWLEDLS
jgi:plasmid replication initiation protein